MNRVIEWTPAYDKRHPDPSKNYGISSMTVRFVLIGDEGAVQFVLLTGWHLKHVREEFASRGLTGVMPSDLGYHSYQPCYEGQQPITEACEYLGGSPCYYDGSALAADRVFEIFLAGGEEALWKELEDYYQQVFGNSESGILE